MAVLEEQLRAEARYLTPRQVADILGVSAVTIRHWSLNGKMEFITTPGGHRRYLFTDIVSFAKSNGINIKEAGSDKLKILIVDDDCLIVDYLKELISYSFDPVVIDTASNGFEAGEKVYTFIPDIILMDIRMPGIDGLEVCKRVKQGKTSSHTRIIIMTAFTSAELKEQASLAGAEYFISKPIDKNVLLGAIRAIRANGANATNTDNKQTEGELII